MSPTVYILLPVHNRCAITSRFIDCLETQTCPNYHLVLIDDGSTDGTAAMVQAKIKNLTVLRGRGDWWWAGSLQQGIEWLMGHEINDDDIVLMINDDVDIPPDFIETGCALLKSGMLLQAAVCDQVSRETLDMGVVYEPRTMLFRPPKAGEPVNCLTTNGLFMRWHDLQSIGGFYPRLLPHYLSDYEFTMRAYRKGLVLESLPDLKLYWNRETTGHHVIEEDNLLPFLRKIFSKKTPGNPVYRTSFLLLIGSTRYLPFNLTKIWVGVLYRIFKRMLRMLFPQHKRA
ncbi:MAG: glycosyltransferase family 2 protein [Pseudomonadota bacterium]